MPDRFRETFDALKPILAAHAHRLTVVHDEPRCYYLDGAYDPKRKCRTFFGAVRMGKAYVSFHFMPIYACPDLRDTLSPELRARMQGKSCFNFRAPDPALLAELEHLTKVGLERFAGMGYAEAVAPSP